MDGLASLVRIYRLEIGDQGAEKVCEIHNHLLDEETPSKRKRKPGELPPFSGLPLLFDGDVCD